MNVRAIIYAAVVAVSAGNMSSAVAEDMAMLPAIQTQNGVTFLAGGFGMAEVTAMKAAAKDYTLMLTFSIQKTGKYLADIKIRITDESGTAVLETVADGPILLVRLTPGQYRISADSNGVTVNDTVRIGADIPVRLNVQWPAQKDGV